MNKLYNNQMYIDLFVPEFERIPSSFGIASSHLFLSDGKERREAVNVDGAANVERAATDEMPSLHVRVTTSHT